MTDVNHRRKNRAPVNQRYANPLMDYQSAYNNGYAHPENKKDRTPNGWSHGKSQRIGSTDYLDKSMHGWGRRCGVADEHFGAGIGNDFCNGHRGMAKAVKGAKKFVRSRIRFHDNAATKKLPITEEE